MSLKSEAVPELVPPAPGPPEGPKRWAWQDSAITAEQAKKAIRIVQFSKEYFDLAASHGGTLAQYLVFQDPVLVSLNNQVYEITPPL